MLVVAAEVCAKCKKARQEILVSCSWRQHKAPITPHELPPRFSKTAALASTANQLHHLPPEKHDGYVPLASVVKESSLHSLVDDASLAVGSAAADTVNVLCYLWSSSSSSSKDLLGCATGGGPLILQSAVLKSPGNEKDPSDLNSPWTQRLVSGHSMNALFISWTGEISHSN